MRKVFICLAIFLLSCICLGTLTENPSKDSYELRSQTQATRQFAYKQICSVTADATPLTAATKDWTSIKAKFIEIEPTWNRVSISFYGYGDGNGIGDPNAGTFSFKIFVAKLRGGAKTVCSGTGAIGEIELSHNPVTGAAFRTSAVADPNYKWADTLTVEDVNDVWPSGVVVSGGGGSESGGNIATLDFDLFGYYGLWADITNMTDVNVTSITAIVTGY